MAHVFGSPASIKRLMRVPVSGLSPELVLDGPNDDALVFDCPNSAATKCLLSRPENGRLVFYLLDPLVGPGKQVASINLHSQWAVSPDGSRIAVTNSRTMPGEVLLENLAESTHRILSVSRELRIRDVTWSGDGRSIFAIAQREASTFILGIDSDGMAHEIWNEGKDKSFLSPRLSPDGTHLAFTQVMWESNAWLLENF